MSALAQVLGLFRWRIRRTHPYYVVRSTRKDSPGGVWWLSFAEPPGPLRPEIASLHLSRDFLQAARFADQDTPTRPSNWAGGSAELADHGNVFDIVPMQGRRVGADSKLKLVPLKTCPPGTTSAAARFWRNSQRRGEDFFHRRGGLPGRRHGWQSLPRG